MAIVVFSVALLWGIIAAVSLCPFRSMVHGEREE
jgi:hypothetical protein